MKCTGCGQPRDETMVNEDDAPHFVAQSVRCWACQARDLAASDAREANEGRPLHGLYWSVARNGK